MAVLLLSLISILTLPLTLFNMVAGFIGLVWLGFIGDWNSLFATVIALIVSAFALAFPLMLSLVFAVPGAALLKLGELGKWLASPFFFLAASVTWVVMSIWGFLVFGQALERATDSVWPYLLCAYSVSTGPWKYMASKEEDASSVAIPLFFTQISSVWMVFSFGLLLVHPFNTLLIYFGIMLVGLFLSLILGLIGIDKYQPEQRDIE
jgi:hypothetical protein